MCAGLQQLHVTILAFVRVLNQADVVSDTSEILPESSSHTLNWSRCEFDFDRDYF